jgi:hypothetical protein
MGIVVGPGEYRPLPGSDRFAVHDYEPTATDVAAYTAAALAALGDGCPGSALKLGHDLWCYRDFHEASYELLELAYRALDRPVLVESLKAAAAFRAKH